MFKDGKILKELKKSEGDFILTASSIFSLDKKDIKN